MTHRGARDRANVASYGQFTSGNSATNPAPGPYHRIARAIPGQGSIKPTGEMGEFTHAGNPASNARSC